jgi:hypothetical protein
MLFKKEPSENLLFKKAGVEGGGTKKTLFFWCGLKTKNMFFLGWGGGGSTRAVWL